MQILREARKRGEGLYLTPVQGADVYKALRLKQMTLSTFAELCNRSTFVLNRSINGKTSMSKHIERNIKEHLDIEITRETQR